jgi:hypothetical protein
MGGYFADGLNCPRLPRRSQKALLRSIIALKSSSSFRDSVTTEMTDATNITLIKAASNVKNVSMEV